MKSLVALLPLAAMAWSALTHTEQPCMGAPLGGKYPAACTLWTWKEGYVGKEG